MPDFRAAARVTFIVASVGYPFLVYFSLTHLGPRLAGLGLILLACSRLLVGSGKGIAMMAIPAVVAAILLSLLTILLDSGAFLLYYPLLISLGMLLLFGLSLKFPPPIVERLARLKDVDLPAAAVAYTRKVTVVWCVFFVVNGVISLATIMHADMEIWTLYNGFISYVLMGGVGLAELAVRRHILRGKAGA